MNDGNNAATSVPPLDATQRKPHSAAGERILAASQAEKSSQALSVPTEPPNWPPYTLHSRGIRAYRLECAECGRELRRVWRGPEKAREFWTCTGAPGEQHAPYVMAAIPKTRGR